VYCSLLRRNSGDERKRWQDSLETLIKSTGSENTFFQSDDQRRNQPIEEENNIVSDSADLSEVARLEIACVPPDHTTLYFAPPKDTQPEAVGMVHIQMNLIRRSKLGGTL
jgi:hypothetical protein